ncbi:MAG: hypothetical protein Q7S36_01130 [Candidatus Liptonbacteria bacterium]|nr:hypothetical protein [Candidatus Liptonbacteria bacterium]
MRLLAVFLLPTIAVFIYFIVDSKLSKRKIKKFLDAGPWELKKEGTLKEVRYDWPGYPERGRGLFYKMPTSTILYFADGSRCVLYGWLNVEFPEGMVEIPEGTKIRVFEKGLGCQYKVEKA